jgi:hypothetical protein
LGQSACRGPSIRSGGFTKTCIWNQSDPVAGTHSLVSSFWDFALSECASVHAEAFVFGRSTERFFPFFQKNMRSCLPPPGFTPVPEINQSIS